MCGLRFLLYRLYIVMAGRSVHITTPLPERLAITSLVHVTDELAKGSNMGIDITLNNTYKCSHINGNKSQVILKFPTDIDDIHDMVFN